MARAAWWKRLVASIIDALIIGIPTVIVAMALSRTIGILLGAAIGSAIQFVAFVAYYLLTEVKTGQSLGKLLLKTKVISESGLPASGDQLIRRTGFKLLALPLGVAAAFVALASPKIADFINLVNLIPTLVILVSGVMIFRASKLAWHDELFKTQVVDLTFLDQPASHGFEVMPPTPPPAA